MQVVIVPLFLLVIAVFDLWKRKIPNVVTIPVAAAAIAYHGFSNGMDGFLFSIAGCSLGLLLFLLPYLLSGMGAGDVKALAALGALIGPSAIFQVFLYTAMAGGTIAVMYCIFSSGMRQVAKCGYSSIVGFATSRDVRCLNPATPKRKQKFPYAPAIFLGYLAFLAWGNLV